MQSREQLEAEALIAYLREREAEADAERERLLAALDWNVKQRTIQAREIERLRTEVERLKCDNELAANELVEYARLLALGSQAGGTER